MLKNEQKVNDWLLIDAAGHVMGRLASRIATLLRGKHKPVYTPHVLCGDKIIVINAAGLVLTGNKCTDKLYYKHTGYMGGLRTITYDKVMDRDPTFPLKKSSGAHVAQRPTTQ